MTVRAQVVCDSWSRYSPRLTTMVLHYPLCIHNELMTHRVFSRSAMSSRAVSVKRLIEQVQTDPFTPEWTGEQRGMTGGPLDAETKKQVGYEWSDARDYVLDTAETMSALGAHKQHVNRLFAPWAHIDVIVTSTEWENFFTLRCHEAADPTMQLLAETMLAAINASEPRELEPGVDRHLPLLTQQEEEDDSASISGVNWTLVSAARCARVSYGLTTQSKSIPEDLVLASRLRDDRHMSPFEHQAWPRYGLEDVISPGTSNLRDWHQLRKHFETPQRYGRFIHKHTEYIK